MFSVLWRAGVSVDGGVGMSEKVITRKIQEWFKEMGGACQKIHGGMYSSGFPDLVACIDGRTWLIEVKTPHAKPRVPKATRESLPQEMRNWIHAGATVLQAKTLYDWQAAGAICMVATCLEDVISKYIHEYKRRSLK